MVDYSVYVPPAPDILGMASTMASQTYNNQLRDARAQRLYEQMDLDRQKAELAQAKVAHAADVAATAKARQNDLLDIYSNFGVTPEVIGTRGSTFKSGNLPNDPYETTRNQLIQKGFAPQAAELAKTQNEILTGRKTAADTANAVKTGEGQDIKNIGERLSYIQRFAGMVNSPEDAAAYSRMLVKEFPEFAALSGSPDDAAQRSAEAFKQDPNAWRLHSLNLTPEQLVQAHEREMTAKQAKPTQLSAGATLVDTNPSSPTYGQPIAQGTAAGAKPPAGYRWNADNTALEVIPGGPAEAKINAGKGVELSPDALDVAAHSYILSGVLPPGMGKNATEIRTQIMNRATEIANGRSPEEVARDLRVNKNDTAAMAKAEKDFGTGTQGKMVNSFNTAIDHLETVNGLVDALANADTKKVNSIGNAIAAEFGVSAPTNFDAAKNIVSAEIIKAINASGGTLTDRQEAERSLDRANSPEQLRGVVDTFQKLLGGQLNSLKLQYGNMTGKDDFDKKLTPKAKAALGRVTGGGAAAGGGVDASNPLLQ